MIEILNPVSDEYLPSSCDVFLITTKEGQHERALKNAGFFSSNDRTGMNIFYFIEVNSFLQHILVGMFKIPTCLIMLT